MKFTAEQVKRLKNTCEFVERLPKGAPGERPGQTDTTLALVRCTDHDLDGDFYPGVLLEWDASDQSLTEGSAVWLFSISGGISQDSDYFGFLGGYQEGQTVYLVQGEGGAERGALTTSAPGGSTGTMDIYDDTGATGDTITVHNQFATEVPDESLVIVVWCNRARGWYITAADCPE